MPMPGIMYIRNDYNDCIHDIVQKKCVKTAVYMGNLCVKCSIVRVCKNTKTVLLPYGKVAVKSKNV